MKKIFRKLIDKFVKDGKRMLAHSHREEFIIDFLKELKERELAISIYPVGDKGEYEAFDKITDDKFTEVCPKCDGQLVRVSIKTQNQRIESECRCTICSMHIHFISLKNEN